ncbi:TPA: O-antigen ligase family protein [Streptococcus suis]|uniref:Lipid A core-O-antigen ligase and related enzymes n=1 Tax=Streptococcus suis TaxID=1307 RepID=A0A0Z8W960_STRSU|nr:O-antigen ligase family protein [Streptococcus suis]AOP02526.1 Wzy [Streptococcus suis]AOP02552.1 Wzy [Streptococcus suis]AOP02657.1 Wzy [Streptococcus suis]AOP02824.1 Wzy [Streptococcus suis]AOP03203.1 Wzy [Streptococcus suis]
MKINRSLNIEILLLSAVIIFLGQIALKNDSNAILLIALIMVGFAAAILPQDNLMPFMLCMIAPNRLLTYGSISAPIIIILVALFKGNRYLHQPKKFFLSSMALIGYTIITLFIGESLIFDAIKIVAVLLFFIMYTNCQDIHTSYVRYTVFCSLGCLLSAGITLLINKNSISEAGRFTIKGSGQNVLGILCAIMAINLLVIVLNYVNKKKLFYVFLSTILCGIGFLTGSRSFLLAIGTGIFGLVIMMMVKLDFKRLFKIGFIISLVTFGAIFAVKFSSFINNYWDLIMYRVTKLQNVDVSNGRFDLWEQYITIFREQPIYFWFGGLSIDDSQVQYVAHNMIIEQIASFGVIGSIFILNLYISAVLVIKKYSKCDIKIFSFTVVPLIAFLGSSMVSHTILGIPQTTMLFLCIFSLFSSKRTGGEL